MPVVVTLPDGTQKPFEGPVSVLEVARSIGPGLVKVALAARVEGCLVDLSYTIDKNSNVVIITDKSPESLEIIRHSGAHLLAQAVQRIYPEAQVTIGPVIEEGFYYDFAFERPFTPEDLVQFEKVMAEIVAQDLPVVRSERSREEAIALFESKGEWYKAEIIRDIPENQTLSLYQQGEFIDLCRGPHVPRTGMIKAFKLLKVAGAYWRGDSSKAVLQRIYGTAFAKQQELDQHLKNLEEAAKRDHRKLATQLGLFHLQDVAPGMVFWHPKGWAVYQVIEQYIRRRLLDEGYQEVRTPMLVNHDLWKRSGHWDKFRQNMFFAHTEEVECAVKPMNCPCHVQIFNQGLHSYRALPMRFSEFGACHRNEASGALHGLMRLRGFTQDDAHIFCTEDQIQSEVARFNALLFSVYADFGFQDSIIKLSTRPLERVGSDAVWDKAEAALEAALVQQGLTWTLSPGEGAFYGPKLEFSLKDSLGRVWQCGTLQIDFSMPERLEASYIAEDGSRQVPVMLHRAILGSMERFMAILIEECAGFFPVWLAPVQAVILALTDRQHVYAENLLVRLRNFGLRCETDLRNEKIGFKIREHTLMRVPYLLVVGDREMEEGTISVRLRSGETLGSLSQEGFLDIIQQAIQQKGRRLAQAEEETIGG